MVESSLTNDKRGGRPLLYRIYDPQNTGAPIIPFGEEPNKQTVKDAFHINNWVEGGCFLKA